MDPSHGEDPDSTEERLAPQNEVESMYEVLILACLIASPADCKTFEVPLYHYETLHQCSVMAQINVVEWASHEPGYRIRSEERRVGQACDSTFRSRVAPYH